MKLRVIETYITLTVFIKKSSFIQRCLDGVSESQLNEFHMKTDRPDLTIFAEFTCLLMKTPNLQRVKYKIDLTFIMENGNEVAFLVGQNW